MTESNIDKVPPGIVALYRDYSDTVNDLWTTIVRGTSDANPIRNATSCLGIAILFATTRHPEWTRAIVSKLEEAFAILDPTSLDELQANADMLVEYVPIERTEV